MKEAAESHLIIYSEMHAETEYQHGCIHQRDHVINICFYNSLATFTWTQQKLVSGWLLFRPKHGSNPPVFTNRPIRIHDLTS